MTTATATLTDLLKEAGSDWVKGDVSHYNSCIESIINRYDDCPEALLDFDHSDWVNLSECYTFTLLHRWDQERDDVMYLFNQYCEAIGATSTLHALEGVCDSFEDGDDMNAEIVNQAMTWGARLLLDQIYPNR